MSANTLPVPTPEPPRKRSIWEMSFDCDWTLYPDSPTLPHTFDDIDLDDITIRGVSKAASFREQEYAPAMLMYHPYDKAEEPAYPQPFEWERMFDDLDSLPSRIRSPSITSINTTAAAATSSRKGSVQLSDASSSFSHISSVPRRSSYAESSIARSSRRQEPSGVYPTHRRISSLLSSFSFCRSQESQSYTDRSFKEVSPLSRRTSRASPSLNPTTTTSSTSSRSISSLHPHTSRRRRSSTSRRNTALLLSHMGAGLIPYRMDSHSAELQKVVSGIPISAFIHPRMHIPGGAEYGPVEEDGGYSDAYPLRYSRLWSFDGVREASEHSGLDGFEWDTVISGEDSPFSFEMA